MAAIVSLRRLHFGGKILIGKSGPPRHAFLEHAQHHTPTVEHIYGSVLPFILCMKMNRKFLLNFLVFVIFLSCTRDPQQIPVVVSEPEEIRDSTLQVVGRRDGSRTGGTGFFVKPDKIATNIHIIAGVDPISAHVKSKATIWSIQGVTAYDVNNDLAILKISGS